ncbi:hypothetical protein DM02DRAFT_689290 [Periconia macrospinosa]|uniref:Uncharacterized protein n=1 Tax=Periconia macrospinosa TaxID=97972 RepID=A0A2V1DCC0_9PLEO|nr:hypothetical protein DM02DRAFT_689290 [Periconia macrospinosa]
MTISDAKREFGDMNDEWTGNIVLPPGTWVDEIGLYMKQVEVAVGSSKHASIYAKGIEDGSITRLGILEYEAPSIWSANRHRSFNHHITLPVWYAPLLSSSNLYSRSVHLWNLVNLPMLPFSENNATAKAELTFTSLLLRHKLPLTHLVHHPLIWARSQKELEAIKSIQAVLSTTKPVPQILGLRVTHEQNIDNIRALSDHWRTIGVGFPCVSPSSKSQLPSEYDGTEVRIEEFAINGGSGERIIEIHVKGDTGALKLVTNQGRTCMWGDGGSKEEEWSVQKEEKGREIMGLVCVFGDLVSGTRSAATMSGVTSFVWKNENDGR